MSKTKYAENYEKIFGSDEDRRKRHANQRGTVRKYSHGHSGDTATSTNIIKEIDPFVSPIDGQVISTRQQRDAYFKEKGITDSRDYSAEYMHKRQVDRLNQMEGRTPEAKQERINTIKRALGRL